MTQPWSVELVAARLVDAAHTARRLPPVRVQGYFSAWPEFKRQPWEVLASDDAPYPRLPPPPEAVERMIEASRWMQWLDVQQRHLVWMRARQEPWQEICKRFACSRCTAWRRWKLAVEIVTQQLNQKMIVRDIA